MPDVPLRPAASRRSTGSARGVDDAREGSVWCHLPTPLGRLVLVAGPRGLRQVSFGASGLAADMPRRPEHALLREAAAQLTAYFDGRLRQFCLPLDEDGTPFQRQVWQALRDIPYGQTRSYADIARAIGHPRAFRAVGAANHANPLPIVSPCHRVITSTGALGGFAPGLSFKRWLLSHERRYAAGDDWLPV